MTAANDRIGSRVSCLDTRNLLASLIATNGYHCDVWRSSGVVVREDRRESLDMVIKVHLRPCSEAEARIYRNQYRRIKAELAEIVPSAGFVVTEVDGFASVVVVAEAVNRWFNIANPANEDETIPLLAQMPRARDQLARFLAAAHRWEEREDRVIDLYGLDNLVLDVNREIRYLDSFEVFFNRDLLTLLDQPDPELRDRIDLSLRRRDYLDHVLDQARRISAA
jgi:hypothetical protein